MLTVSSVFLLSVYSGTRPGKKLLVLLYREFAEGETKIEFVTVLFGGKDDIRR